MFDICDDDGDHCMRPAEILLMLQKLERMFCRETSKVNLNSITLLYTNADKRAEHKFHFIITIIKRNNDNEGKDENDDDELITYGEYLNALKSVPDLLNGMLPRTLTL